MFSDQPVPIINRCFITITKLFIDWVFDIVSTHLRTRRRSWPLRCPVPRCWGRARRTAGPLCPDRFLVDILSTVPVLRCRTFPHCSWLGDTWTHRSTLRHTDLWNTGLQYTRSENKSISQNAHHTSRRWGLVLYCRSHLPLSAARHAGPPRTPCRRTECRTAAYWWTSLVCAWHSAASVWSSHAHSPHYMILTHI